MILALVRITLKTPSGVLTMSPKAISAKTEGKAKRISRTTSSGHPESSATRSTRVW